ncbi:hypothetical protein I316_05561 [Kwoniella heveanensis BCC8398]|uniref:Uncharacterized protein n=1 Tax=Kwoniella heveanensis BCC8398 TaxID=1296120 RepID=A0A1B9GNK7_9TREE|nr:hypothetical protein I316_05561 [Kwoniella heveanensis BCC8398]
MDEPPSAAGTVNSPAKPTTSSPHGALLSEHWCDYYAPPRINDDNVLPKPPSKIKLYSTKWKSENPNPKSKPPLPTPPSNGGRQAYYGNPMMGGMYPGMGMGMGMGMPYGMGGMGMMGPYGGMMGGGYGVSIIPSRVLIES